MTAKASTRRTFMRERLTPRRLATTLAALALLIVAVGVFSITVGSEHVGFTNVIRVIVGEKIGRASCRERVYVLV